MLIDDVRKIEKLKKKIDIDTNPKYIAKVEKLEKKYVAIQDAGDSVKTLYIDKNNSKVVVMNNGVVLQIEGPVLNPHFTGFLIAYLIFAIISVPILIMGAVNPTFEPFSYAINLVDNPIALILHIGTIVTCGDVLMKRKLLLFLLLIMVVFNLYHIILMF